MPSINTRIKMRIDTEANWAESNPVLLEGECAFSSDQNGKYKIGDGTKTWTELAYAKAFLEKSDVTSALGYTPPSTDNKVTTTLNNSTKAYLAATASSATSTGTLIFDPAVYLDTTAGTLVATTFKGDLIGNADTATTLKTARTINGISFDGSANITVTAEPKLTTLTSQDLDTVKTLGFYNAAGSNSVVNNPLGTGTAFGMIVYKNASGYWIQDIVSMDGKTRLTRTYNSSEWSSWYTIYTSGNPQINITGNAATATKVNNALTFTGGVTGSYDGSAAKSVAIPTALKCPNSLTISLNGTSQGAWDGSAAKSIDITPAAIGAPTLTGTGASGTWGISISGTAASATKLATARTIALTGSVTGSGTFDGGGNLSIETTTNHTHSYLPLSGGTVTGSTTFNSGLTIKNAGVELYGSTPYIDFHFGNSTADYTSRIYEQVEGQLLINGIKISNSNMVIPGNLYVTNNINPSKGIVMPDSGTNWIGGMTYENCIVGGSITSNGYHPLIRQNTYGSNVWNLGTNVNQFGFFMYKSGRTDNGYDYATIWDTADGSMKHTGVFKVGNNVRIWTDGEGGNIRLTNPSDTGYWEMDACDNAFRIFYMSSDSKYKSILTCTSTGVATFNGNASTATSLATSRTINGTSFNGSSNITTAKWGTARTITIGDTGKSVNGSAAVSWSLSEIGAPSATNGTLAWKLKDETITSTLRRSGSSGEYCLSLVTTDASGNSTFHTLIDANGGRNWALPSHTHSYLPLTGGTITGTLTLKVASGGTGYLAVGSTNSTSNISNIAGLINSSSVYYMSISGKWGGSSYATHNIVSASSDIRLKSNIEDSSVCAMDVINAMKIRQFNWKQNGSHQRIGFIADELASIDPKLAFGGGWNEDGSMNIKSVDTFYMQGYIIKGMQEQDARITALEKEIKLLKQTVD